MFYHICTMIRQSADFIRDAMPYSIIIASVLCDTQDVSLFQIGNICHIDRKGLLFVCL